MIYLLKITNKYTGSPHFVKNIDATVAIAGNFVDRTNIQDVLNDLKITSLKYEDDRILYEALDQIEFEEEEDTMKDKSGLELIDYHDFH